jgi:hypothetical protein
VIARNHKGEAILTAWRGISRCASAAEAEAFACAMSCQLALQWIKGPVLLETDCTRVFNAVLSKEYRSKIIFIIAEAKEHAHMMVKWRVTQAKRECNAFAHNIAHLARRSSESEVWLGRAPACVVDLVVADCNSSPALLNEALFCPKKREGGH